MFDMKNILRAGILLTLLFVSASFCFSAGAPPKAYQSGTAGIKVAFGKSYNYDDILVKRAVDGDTLELENGEKVRLIGIDTPEMHESNKLRRDSLRSGQDVDAIKKLGLRAYEFTKNLVEGRRVKLEFDVEKKDKYGRSLAYAFMHYGANEPAKESFDSAKHPDYFIDKRGIFVNATIIKAGYASLMTFPPNVKYADLFLGLYQEARQSQRGLWAGD